MSFVRALVKVKRTPPYRLPRPNRESKLNLLHAHDLLRVKPADLRVLRALPCSRSLLRILRFLRVKFRVFRFCGGPPVRGHCELRVKRSHNFRVQNGNYSIELLR